MDTTTHNTRMIPTVEFDLSAGRLCLDFANTADWHAGDAPVELVPDYAHLIAWSRLAGLVDDERAERLMLLAECDPDAAVTVHERAIALREAIYHLFSALSHEREPDPADLATINSELAIAFDHLLVEHRGKGFSWGWYADGESLDGFLWSIARSAAEVLTSDDLPRVRECAGDPCGWLFLDTSRNRTRRWCSMASCGNRAKARRHYERAKMQGVRGRS